MGALNKQITVSKQAFEKRWDMPMSQSLQDAFNDILSNFSENEVDRSYSSEMNQFLKNDKGDIYYFDNFKYVFPKQIGNESEARVLNNSRGRDQFCCVKYNGISIVVENYDVNGIVEIASYFLTDDARSLISSDYMKGDMGYFLLQVSGNNTACIEKLHLGSKITVKQENGNLVSYDANGNIIDTVPTNADSVYSRTLNGISFYKEVESKVNYYSLLDSTYSLSNGHVSIENKGPIR
jgi:hypothetical protein